MLRDRKCTSTHFAGLGFRGLRDQVIFYQLIRLNISIRSYKTEITFETTDGFFRIVRKPDPGL
jgi:hypothetical protein